MLTNTNSIGNKKGMTYNIWTPIMCTINTPKPHVTNKARTVPIGDTLALLRMIYSLVIKK